MARLCNNGATLNGRLSYRRMSNSQDKVSFIWSVADLLRGDYKASEYGRIILPLTVLRRLDCVLEPTKQAVIAAATSPLVESLPDPDQLLCKIADQSFYNRSPLDLRGLLADPPNVAENLHTYIAGFSTAARETFEHFNFEDHIERLDRAGILFQVIQRFNDIDLHPDVVRPAPPSMPPSTPLSSGSKLSTPMTESNSSTCWRSSSGSTPSC